MLTPRFSAPSASTEYRTAERQFAGTALEDTTAQILHCYQLHAQLGTHLRSTQQRVQNVQLATIALLVAQLPTYALLELTNLKLDKPHARHALKDTIALRCFSVLPLSAHSAPTDQQET